jgi:hypothetical protein
MPKTTTKRPTTRKAPPAPPKTPFIQMTTAERQRMRIDEQKAKNKELSAAAQKAKVFPAATPPPPKPPSKLKQGVQAVTEFAKRNKRTAIVVGALGAIGVGLDYTKNEEYAPAKKTAPSKKPEDRKKKQPGIGTSSRPK